MAAKQLLFHDDARERIRRGVDALAEAVKVTLGPRGRTVILERDYGSPQIVNSGVLVAKSIELEDRFENMGAQLMREVAAMGVIDPVKVTRLALQNAASIAALVLTTDCLIAEAPKPGSAAAPMGAGLGPEMA